MALGQAALIPGVIAFSSASISRRYEESPKKKKQPLRQSLPLGCRDGRRGQQYIP